MEKIEYFENILNLMIEDKNYRKHHIGECVAAHNYMETLESGFTYFNVSDPPVNEDHVEDFLKALEEAGVECFCFTARTTMTIDFLHMCEKFGWNNIRLGFITRLTKLSEDDFAEVEYVESVSGIVVGRD